MHCLLDSDPLLESVKARKHQLNSSLKKHSTTKKCASVCGYGAAKKPKKAFAKVKCIQVYGKKKCL